MRTPGISAHINVCNEYAYQCVIALPGVINTFISRPTSRLLSFVLCLEWINGTYNTIHSRHL